MATGGGDNSDRGLDDDDRGFPNPKTPRMVLRADSEGRLPPDTEENVISQTDGVFISFVRQMQVTELHNGEADDTPNLSELNLGPQGNPLSRAPLIGRRLAQIGDSINSRYAPEFNNMIKILNPTPDTALEAFFSVTDRLFRDGVIHWGRVLTLLCFGYRLAITVIKKGIKGFFCKIVDFIIEFLLRKGIARWIASQGGWGAALSLVPETVSWFGVGLVAVTAVFSVAVVCLLGKK